MWLEYVLLMVMGVSMLGVVGSSLGLFSVGGSDRNGFFQNAVPHLSSRMERNLITGYQFCADHHSIDSTSCGWR